MISWRNKITSVKIMTTTTLIKGESEEEGWKNKRKTKVEEVNRIARIIYKKLLFLQQK